MQKIGIISEYDFDLIELLRKLNFEFYYFLTDLREYRRVNNVFLLPFEDLEKYYDEIEIILNLSETQLNLEKVINTIYDLENLDFSKFYIYRIENINSKNIIYFPFVIDTYSIQEFSLEKIFKAKDQKSILILCEKIDINLLNILIILSKHFEIFVYGILDRNISHFGKVHVISKKLERNEIIKILKYVDAVLDFSQKKFYKEIILAAFLNKLVLTIKNFRNFPKLTINEKIEKIIFNLLKRKIRYDIEDFILDNSVKIVENELKKIQK